MSEQSSSEKTEEPTSKKIRDLRKKGQVPISKEVVSTSLICILFAYYLFAWNDIFELSQILIVAPSHLVDVTFYEALKHIFDIIFYASIYCLLPLGVIVFLVGMLSNILQNGIVISAEPVKPDIKKISPIEGFKKIFCMSNFIEFVKSIVKVSAIAVCVAWVIYQHIGSLINGPFCGLECLLVSSNRMLFELMVYSVSVFLVVAFGDLAFQRYNFTKTNRMTKDEVKKEHKESDGDPIIKGKRRRLQRELAQGKKIAAVESASVVVKNPTHYAVAIRYHDKDAPLPYIVAKGESKLAELIIRKAEEHGIPVMENVPLARGLYAEGEINGYIPIDFIPAVVEALHWVRDNYPDFNTTP